MVFRIEGLVNFEKRVMLASTIAEVLRYQQASPLTCTMCVCVCVCVDMHTSVVIK